MCSTQDWIEFSLLNLAELNKAELNLTNFNHFWTVLTNIDQLFEDLPFVQYLSNIGLLQLISWQQDMLS